MKTENCGAGLDDEQRNKAMIMVNADTVVHLNMLKGRGL